MSDENKKPFRGTIDSVALYEVPPGGTRLKYEPYEPNPEAISSWEYKLKTDEYICDRCGGVVRVDNNFLHMRCKRTTGAKIMSSETAI